MFSRLEICLKGLLALNKTIENNMKVLTALKDVLDAQTSAILAAHIKENQRIVDEAYDLIEKITEKNPGLVK